MLLAPPLFRGPRWCGNRPRPDPGAATKGDGCRGAGTAYAPSSGADGAAQILTGIRNGVSRDANTGPSSPEPGRDGDEELFLLGERIADLAERINAAESRMMTLIADFDRRGGWKDGFSSCAEWLAWRIGIKIGPARERVRTARALEKLPQTADALREGSISYTKVRALTARGDAGERGKAARVRARRLGGKAGADGAHVEETVSRGGADSRGGAAPQPNVLGLRGR